MARRIRDTGEFGLIRRLRKKTRAGASVILGIGDDTAVVRPGAGKDLLFTTDMLIEGKHFRLGEASEIGRASCRERVCQYV